ncbi:SDR family NAD(P)-dependent oxidoreductase [Antarcticibacterium sp. 1MA-6-2]|uniref:SDR family NAD(P)-dependent oxidoreductase n=1 Tax=Antarcticibacterium sp. 1MA-6-2 TaxID=2908210 RepID=UPI002105CCC5|nr:SDR family NAD(P)-dependent oxidoreductase [Antarcticibacterium sp. 1MA-6-2]
MLSINLKGKTALITGVSSGIGFGIAKILARAGCNISGCATSKPDSSKALAFREMLDEEGVSSIYSCCDVTDLLQLKGLVKDTYTEFGGIDILVSNA